MLFDEFSRLCYRLPSLGKDRGEQVPDVNHIVPDVHLDLNACLSSDPRQPRRVVQQDLGVANLDKGRRKAAKIGIERSGQRGPGVPSS